MKRLEIDVENLLVEACRKKGIKCLKSEMLEKGFPDRVVFHVFKKEIYFIEFKNLTYYQQQETQKEWQKRIEKSGGKYFLLDGEDETRKFIREYIEV